MVSNLQISFLQYRLPSFVSQLSIVLELIDLSLIDGVLRSRSFLFNYILFLNIRLLFLCRFLFHFLVFLSLTHDFLGLSHVGISWYSLVSLLNILSVLGIRLCSLWGSDIDWLHAHLWWIVTTVVVRWLKLAAVSATLNLASLIMLAFLFSASGTLVAENNFMCLNSVISWAFLSLELAHLLRKLMHIMVLFLTFSSLLMNASWNLDLASFNTLSMIIVSNTSISFKTTFLSLNLIKAVL